MFSVIIPLYNKANYIEKAIQSVLQQTFRDFELIIINDGSTDKSSEKIADLNDERIRIINQSNAGVSIARNNGVKHSRYSNIAFLDADDWWNEHFLQEMSDLITHFPEAGMYGSSYFVVKNGIKTRAQVGINADFRVGYIDYFDVYARTFWVPINCSFVVVRKSVFDEEEGFKSGLKFGEDLDLWVRIALKHKVGYINKPLAYSNQDVDIQSRALGSDKFWKPGEHVLFNLDYLAAQEKQRPALKLLLDGLRVRSLTDYYLESWYGEPVEQILATIDFSTQPFLYRFIYQWPRPVVLTYFRIMRVGSVAKQAILRNYGKLRGEPSSLF